jgi:hypothetical protein
MVRTIDNNGIVGALLAGAQGRRKACPYDIHCSISESGDNP